MLFFFFQAEDGIRDADVTGVQTCALPISGASPETGAEQTAETAAPGRGAGHCRLLDDRGRRQGDVLPVWRQGFLRHAGYSAEPAEKRAGTFRADCRQPGPEAAGLSRRDPA